MENLQFGHLIKEIRISRNLTQNELAKGICSRRHLIRLEQNEFEPSSHLMAMLSQRLRFDFSKYYQKIKFSKSRSGFELKKELLSASYAENWHRVEEICKEMENSQDFVEGENSQYLLYGYALIWNFVKGDVEKCSHCCVEGLSAGNCSHISLLLLKCLGDSLLETAEYDTCISIYQFILSSLNCCPLSSHGIDTLCEHEEYRLYQGSLLSLGVVYFQLGDYEKALIQLKKGIDFSVERGVIWLLPRIYHWKFRTLYQLEQLSQGDEAYEMAQALYGIVGDYKRAEQLDREYWSCI